jgi:hypothetical protein
VDRKSNPGLIERYTSFVGPQQCSASLQCLISGIFGHATMLVQIPRQRRQKLLAGARDLFRPFDRVSSSSLTEDSEFGVCGGFGGGLGLGLAE